MGPTRIPPWPGEIVRAVADVLGATDTGLTGSEIGDLLRTVKAHDEFSSMAKRHRLYNALATKQNSTQSANSTVAFMREAMAPVRYRNEPGLFTRRQQDLNEVLVHIGLRINDHGQVCRGSRASTLSEAAERAGSIRTELRRRGTHREVLSFCTDELLAKDNFHALLEATKSITDRIRESTGLRTDGSALIDAAFGLSGGPLLAINTLADESDKSEQKGFANLLRGLVGLYRNPTAHSPRVSREVAEDELLEALTTISMVHRRLDEAGVQPMQPFAENGS